MITHRNKSSYDDAECVITDVREAVSALRWLGLNTVSGLYRIAERCRVTQRRIRTLFYRDQTLVVTPTERYDIALSIADLFDAIADECEAHAAKCRIRGDAIRRREELNNQPTSGGNTWNDSSKRAA